VTDSCFDASKQATAYANFIMYVLCGAVEQERHCTRVEGHRQKQTLICKGR
jgi:hypothetical protein